VSRYPAARQIIVLVVGLVVGAVSLVALKVSEKDPADVETAIEATGAGGQLARFAQFSPLALPAADLDYVAAVQPGTTEPAPATTAAPQPQQGKGGGGKNSTGDNNDGDHIHQVDYHSYLEHVTAVLGTKLLAPDQGAYGTYQEVAPGQIQARSTITGLRPVIEQAVADVKKHDPKVKGEELERRIAKRLTELNDWENLTPQTQAKLSLLAGVDFEAMGGKEREQKLNHYLHSVQPFGDITTPLSPDTIIDMGYTHTLDKDWTQAEDKGNGVFKITMVSNNNDGSHTGHTLGSFLVQLPPGTTAKQAKNIGNDMVSNDNNNDRLYLDISARNILYGVTPPIDFTKPVETTTTMPPTTVPTTVVDSTPSTTAPSTTAPSTTATAADTGSSTTTAGASTTMSSAPPVTS